LKLQPGPPRRGSITGSSEKVQGPVGLSLVATPIALSELQFSSPLTAATVSVTPKNM
jgi:hypothetical protein